MRETYDDVAEAECCENEHRTMWRRKLRKLEEFMAEGKPSTKSENVEEKRLAAWVDSQQTNYKKHAHIMKDAVIREEWSEFLREHAHLFHDKHRTMWRQMLRKVEEFLEEQREGDERRKPSLTSEDVEEK
eukprot:1784745-Pleurochrysis_carterae.AAC.1